MSIETSIIYTTSDGKQFNSRQEAETHEQWLADEPEAREADRQRGWTDYTPPQPEWKPEPKPATPDITDLDILPRMNAGDSRISRFGFLFATTRQEGRGR